MRVVFMGSDPIAIPLLEEMVSGGSGAVTLAGIFTQPDRPRGRGHQVQANAIKCWALDRSIPVFQPERCDAEALQSLKELAPEYIIVMAYGQLLPKSMLQSFPGKFLNFHASLLPRLRGASPIHTAVALGLKETGVSLMQIEPRMDAGPVADCEKVSIGERDGVGDLAHKLGLSCVPVWRRSLPLLRSGELVFKEQDLRQVTYCRILKKSDAHLDFGASAEDLDRRIRALNPWPGPRFEHGKIEIRILDSEVQKTDCGSVPGTVLESGPERLVVACGSDAIRLKTLQRPGGKAMNCGAFLRGYPIESGSILASRTMEPLESVPV